ncbi:hypothetical protein KC968_03355 [Candidatus Saccharibacteria bacterium]|nr:hypothetical protein [Candidatus Saccharibacteria bacterium]
MKMISNIPQPDTYKRDYLEAANRVRVVSIQGSKVEPIFKPLKKNIAKNVSKQVKIKVPKPIIPTS